MIQIQEATKSDVDQIVTTEVMAFAKPCSYSAMAKAVQSVAYSVLVAKDGKDVIGHLVLGFERDSNAPTLLVVAVRDNNRRQGVGSLLMDAAKKTMGKGSLHIQARVSVKNVDTQYFLAKNGFSAKADVEAADGIFMPFIYSVPLDNLSSAHIAMLAGKRKKGQEKC